MSKCEIKLNSAGIRELLQSPEMAAICQEQAKTIAGRCGTGYATDIHVGKTRVNASVYADTPDAIRDNLENNTILRSLK